MLMGREHSASSKDHRRFSLQCVTHGIYGGGCRRAWGSYSLVVITAKPYEVRACPPRPALSIRSSICFTRPQYRFSHHVCVVGLGGRSRVHCAVRRQQGQGDLHAGIWEPSQIPVPEPLEQLCIAYEQTMLHVRALCM
ncbi:hypothetical protein BS78_03G403400 [Paspalum vaginatum]|nr:hypothetical protein BS78_03G403400 [Paspalum vaginatum]